MEPPAVLFLPDDSAPGPVLVTLMGETIGRLCKELGLKMDVAASGNLLMVYDPLHQQQEWKGAIRDHLRMTEDYWIGKLVWYSFYREVDGP